MSDTATIEDELSRWDGTVEALHDFYQQQGGEQLIEQMLSLLDSQGLQIPLSWLLKNALQDGVVLDQGQVLSLVQSAPSLHHWQARLHLLQSLPYLAIPTSAAETLHGFLQTCLQEDNKFIRAWAYQGFSLLAEQHDHYRNEVESLLEKAMQEEAPAIKARLRNRLKQVTNR